MDWEDLRHFLAVAETGSLSAAARRLKVDHTTVARRVAGLEAALGLRLMERLPRAVRLTDEGVRIAAAGGPMAAAAFAIRRAAEGAGAALDGVVRVSAPPTLAAAVLAPRAAELRRRHPGIVLDLVGDPQAADLARREADIAVRLSRPDGEGLACRRIDEMPFGLYASPAYADGRASVDWEFLCHDGVPVEWQQQRWLDAVIGDRPVIFRASDATTLAATARAGLGVALLPCFLGDGEGLRRLPCDPAPPKRDIWLVVHEDLRRTPRIRAVLDLFAEGRISP